MNEYKVTIEEVSKELTAKERIVLKDLNDAIAIDAALSDDCDEIVITPDLFATLSIHNEKSRGEKDYKKFVIVDKAGTKYVTGSSTFWNNFTDLATEMQNEAPGEEYSIAAIRKSSRNFAGKYFITCAMRF